MCRYNDLIGIIIIDMITDKYSKYYYKTIMLNIHDIINQCYFIIKHMSIAEGHERLTDKNKHLLEFHLRPRGLHTKGANIN
jgi:hypothetical protein